MTRASGAAALEVSGLSVRLGDRTVLHRVELTAREGEFVALTGPNGSGKTTLLRTALGLQAPSEGDVRLFGERLRDLPIRERARRVAWMPQEEAPRDNVRLLDYVMFGRYAHLPPFLGETREDREVARAALTEVGLDDRADAGIRELSGGERQRLLLARALAQEAPVLLLDEPTAHLDIGHQLDLLDRVGRLVRERGVLAVAALHDLNLAARFADRIVVLAHGHLVADGHADEVLDPPLLRRVWGVDADLRRDPRTARPYLIPRRAADAGAARPTTRPREGTVHVVGGGGAAAAVLRRLDDEGFALTAGVLPLLDSDAETAEELGIPYVAEVPFAPISEEARQRHRALLAAATATVVAAFAVGPTNLANLEELVGRPAQTPVFLLGDAGIARRDFTEGRATRIWEGLRHDGAVAVEDLDGLVRRLRAPLSPAS